MNTEVRDTPRTEAARTFLETVSRAVLDPSLAKMLGADGRQQLVALVSPDAIRDVLIEVEAEAAASPDRGLDALVGAARNHEVMHSGQWRRPRCELCRAVRALEAEGSRE